MAKFYNAYVYVFDNTPFVLEKVEDLLLNIRLTKDEHLEEFHVKQPRSVIHREILYILTGFIKSNVLNLRNLIKVDIHPYPFEVYNLFPFTGLELRNTDIHLLMV